MLRRVAGNRDLAALLDAELNRLSHKPVTGTHGDGATTGVTHVPSRQPIRKEVL